jgi:hypothetical protein
VKRGSVAYFLFALFSFFSGRKIFPHPEGEFFNIRRGNFSTSGGRIFQHPERESFGIGRGNLSLIGRGNLSLNHGDIPVSMLE